MRAQSVVDKLGADYRKVSDILDAVESAADDLAGQDTPAGRARMVEALNGLGEHLLARLAYEEEAISPTLRQWKGWSQG